MPYYTQEQIEKARQMDLLTYLQNYEPQELEHVSGKTYCTRERQPEDIKRQGYERRADAYVTEEPKEKEGKPCQMKTMQPLTLYRSTDIIISTEER